MNRRRASTVTPVLALSTIAALAAFAVAAPAAAAPSAPSSSAPSSSPTSSPAASSSNTRTVSCSTAGGALTAEIRFDVTQSGSRSILTATGARMTSSGTGTGSVRIFENASHRTVLETSVRQTGALKPITASGTAYTPQLVAEFRFSGVTRSCDTMFTP